VYGLDKVMAGELLSFPHGVAGIAMNLEEDQVGAVLLGEYTEIKEGDEVKRTGRIMSVPVGDGMIGRVVNSLGQPIDDKGPISTDKFIALERLAPGVIDRQPVREPMATGLKAIDSMIPVGRGQRELIIGDRQTGKTAVALDTIINSKGNDLICIYNAIGQWRLRHPSPRPCSTSRPMQPAPWANISAIPSVTLWSFMTISRSMRLRTAKFLCCFAVPRDAKRIPETFFISTRDCWSVPPS
jgi:hypothetical protein